MAARAFRISVGLNTQKVEKSKYDPSTIKSNRPMVGSFTLPCFMISKFQGNKYGQRASFIIGEIGGPDAKDSEPVKVTLSGEVKTTVTKVPYEWVGDDRRTLKINLWKRSEGASTKKSWQLLEEPILLRAGDNINISLPSRFGELPPPTHCLTTAVNVLAGVFVKGAKSEDGGPTIPLPPSIDNPPSIIFDTQRVELSTTGGINDLAIEDRYVYAMPYERQLLPLVLGNKDTAYTRVNGLRCIDVSWDIPYEFACVRLSVNRTARATLHSTTDVWSTPYVVPDEGEVHVFGETTNAGASLGVISRAASPDTLLQLPTGGQYPQVYEDVSFLVKQLPLGGDHMKEEDWQFFIITTRLYYEKLVSTTGIRFPPLLAQLILNPTEAFETLPFDIIYKPDVAKSRDLDSNRSQPERRLATFRNGEVAGVVVAIVPRLCEYLSMKGIPVSKELVKQRYTKYAIQNKEYGLVDDKFEDWLSDKAPVYDESDFALECGAIFVPLDMYTKVGFDDEMADEYDFYALPAKDLGGQAPIFKPLDEDDPLSPTRIEFGKDTEAGDAYVLSQIAALRPKNADAFTKGVVTDAIGKLPGSWMQSPKQFTANSITKTYRLPVFSFFAIKKSYKPLARNTVPQPSVQAAPVADGAEKRPISAVEDVEEGPATKRARTEIEQGTPGEWLSDDVEEPVRVPEIEQAAPGEWPSDDDV